MILLVDKVRRRGGEDENLTHDDLLDLAKQPMCFLWSLVSHPKTDLYNGTTLENIDEKFSPSVEVFLIHTWYCDLMDPAANDKLVWNTTGKSPIATRLRAFVDSDRADVDEIEVPG